MKRRMKTKIVIGSILAFCILMMLPSISAVEFNTVVEANKSKLVEKIQSADIEELKDILKDNLPLPSRIFGRIRTIIKLIILFLILRLVTGLVR